MTTLRRRLDPPRGILTPWRPDQGTRRHERYLPSPDLEPLVEHFWVVEWDLCAPEIVETLPHPAVHMVFDSGGRSEVGGPSTRRFRRRLCGKGWAFAVKFRPGGFRPLAPGPVSALTGRRLRLGALFGAEGRALSRAVHAARGDAARVALLEAFLRSRRPMPDARVVLASAMVRAAERERAITRVRALAARFHAHPRTVERLFAEYVGVSPKWVIRRYRLLEATERLAAAPGNLAALALELGYGDQAHFARDFKAMVGRSPGAYARAARRPLAGAPGR